MYHDPGKYGLQQNWLIEDVVTENPIPVIFGITPDDYSYNHIHNLVLKNWNVRMNMGTEFHNRILGNDPEEFFDGFVLDRFIFNGTLLTGSNWIEVTGLYLENLALPVFL